MDKSSLTVSCATEQHTGQLASQLAKLVVPHLGQRQCSLHLQGQLGAGKTTFARYFLRALDIEGPVRSPTFTLVESYQSGALEILHIDLYRLEGQAVESLGLRDYDRPDCLWLVEWPERGAHWLPDPLLELAFTEGPDQQRTVQVTGPTGLDIVDRLVLSCNAE